MITALEWIATVAAWLGMSILYANDRWFPWALLSFVISSSCWLIFSSLQHFWGMASLAALSLAFWAISFLRRALLRTPTLKK